MVDQIQVQDLADHGEPRRVHFGLTNFVFTPTDVYQVGGRDETVLPLAVGKTSIFVRLIDDYARRVRFISALRGVDVTSEVVCAISGEEERRPIIDVVNDLCNILSVARGTKVQWLYYSSYDLEGRLLARTHCSMSTMRFSPLHVIHPREGADTRSFVEQVYSTYLERRKPFMLDRGTVTGYLEGRVEGDRLERRGVKLAVAVEMLKAVYLQTSPLGTKYVIEETDFEQVVPCIRKKLYCTLKSHGIEGKERKAIATKGKLRELNRRSLSHVLGSLCRTVGLRPDGVGLFVQCRNKLIHEGRFYCDSATPDEKKELEPLPNAVDEYFFLLGFVDRLFLGLLGYNGRFLDWGGSPRPMSRVIISQNDGLAPGGLLRHT